MEYSNQRGEAELIGTFHLSPNENILTIACTNENIHYLFYMTPNKTKGVLAFEVPANSIAHIVVSRSFNACGMCAIITF